MAALNRAHHAGRLTWVALAALSVTAPACGEVKGLADDATPLATLSVAVEGPVADAEAPVRVALLWAAQALPEPFCVLPAKNPEVADVVAAGCRDPFGVVPLRSGGDAPLGEDGEASIDFVLLPGADALVGSLTARIGYGTVVLYEDRNGNGSLDIFCPPREEGRGPGRRGGGPGGNAVCGEDSPPPPKERDLVRGASFVTMTAPDRRLAFREGDYNELAAYYPRVGCPAPPVGFSILGAGGFDRTAALAAVMEGTLPAQDPASCTAERLDSTVVRLTPQTAEPRDALQQMVCVETNPTGITRYQAPPTDAPAFDARPWACAEVPRFGRTDETQAPPQVQLVMAPSESESCRIVTHFVLRGCDQDPDCAAPEWDRTANPPEWWPCPPPKPGTGP